MAGLVPAIPARLSLDETRDLDARGPCGHDGWSGEHVMAEVALSTIRQPPRASSAWDRLKVNRNWLGIWFMLPAVAFLVLFLAYPLGLGVWMSFTDAKIGRSGAYIGIENYDWLRDDSIFWLSVFNTL